MANTNRVMRQLRRQMQDKVDGAEDAMRQTARDLADEIRQNAPVDTGRLRDSVDVVDKAGGATVVVGTDYADDVEARQPFIEPAVRKARSNAKNAVRKAVE